jgi:hypothetical protein
MWMFCITLKGRNKKRFVQNWQHRHNLLIHNCCDPTGKYILTEPERMYVNKHCDFNCSKSKTIHGSKYYDHIVLVYLESRRCRYRSIILACFYLYITVVIFIDYSDIDKMMDINNEKYPHLKYFDYVLLFFSTTFIY